MLKQRRLIDKKDDYGSFSAGFYGNMVCFEKTELPVGQLSTEFSELDDKIPHNVKTTPYGSLSDKAELSPKTTHIFL